MSDTVIRVENLSKQYRLGEVGTGTISHDLNRWWAKVRGKEDPFSKVGETNDRTKKGDSDYVWALRDINFEVKQGEVLGIIGRNGAGKSTLLKLLSKVTSPTTGSIKMKGRVASLLEVGTGFHPELTGRENVFLNGAILGMTKKEIEKKFDEIVDFAGVERYIDTPVKRYSSGMYVRLAFAVAAHLEPEILIVDEVLAVGDAEFQKKCLGKMDEVSHKDGRTILFVSHNMGSIRSLCSESLILANGKMIYQGDVEDGIQLYLKNREIKNGTTLVDIRDRKGSGLFKFTDIKFKNDYGIEIEAIMSGDPLVLEIYFDSFPAVNFDKLIISVDFTDGMGNDVLTFTSDEMGVKMSEIIDKEECKIRLRIPNLYLRGGVFAITLFASLNTTATEDHADLVENASKIRVISSDFWNSGKIVRNGRYGLIPGDFLKIFER